MRLVIRNDAGNETSVPIRSEGLAICAADGGRLGVEPPSDALRPVALIVPIDEHGAPRAALICSPLGSEVLVSGYRPLGGLGLLEDRAEISLRGNRLYFSGAEPQTVVRFPAQAGEVRCARCHVQFDVGDAAQRCPMCRCWLHQGQLAKHDRKVECATYDERCPSCKRDRGAGTELAPFFEEQSGA